MGTLVTLVFGMCIKFCCQYGSCVTGDAWLRKFERNKAACFCYSARSQKNA